MNIDELAKHLIYTQSDRRRIIAVAGAPGSGKSTFAEKLAEILNKEEGGFAQVLQMDAFHYDDRILDARGHRSRKGAPHTFDVDGLVSVLQRLLQSPGRQVVAPLFDRALEIARAGALVIEPGTRLIIAEGNYLLLDDPAWSDVREYFDMTVMLDVPATTLKQRLTERWVDLGLEGAALREKLELNDLPNARLVIEHSVPADFTVASCSSGSAR